MDGKKKLGKAPTILAPKITDESMQPRKKASEMLKEMGESSDDEVESLIFDRTKKTAEETEKEAPAEPATKEEPASSTNMLLIGVFALIVIALVCLIVWLVLKQNESKKEEEQDLLARMAPHPRNNLPPPPPGSYTQPHYQPPTQHVPQPPPAPTPQPKQRNPLHASKEELQELLNRTNETLKPKDVTPVEEPIEETPSGPPPTLPTIEEEPDEQPDIEFSDVDKKMLEGFNTSIQSAIQD
jgi:hypothetical protein